MKRDFLIRRSIPLTVLTGFLVLGAGCKNPFVHEEPAPAAQQAEPAPAPAAAAPAPPAPRSDQQIGSDIQAKIGGESALNGQNIQVSVTNGVATLDGKVDNDAIRALAAADSASIDGVRTVVNNLVVAPVKAAKPAPEPRRRREVAQAAPPPPRLLRRRGSCAGAGASRSSTTTAASASTGGQDGDSAGGDGDSHSHDGYAG